MKTYSLLFLALFAAQTVQADVLYTWTQMIVGTNQFDVSYSFTLPELPPVPLASSVTSNVNIVGQTVGLPFGVPESCDQDVHYTCVTRIVLASAPNIVQDIYGSSYGQTGLYVCFDVLHANSGCGGDAIWDGAEIPTLDVQHYGEYSSSGVGIFGTQVINRVIVASPEPATFLTAGIALSLLLFRRRTGIVIQQLRHCFSRNMFWTS
jgi:hypothetical protein